MLAKLKKSDGRNKIFTINEKPPITSTPAIPNLAKLVTTKFFVLIIENNLVTFILKFRHKILK